jgi:hypothetical protein
MFRLPNLTFLLIFWLAPPPMALAQQAPDVAAADEALMKGDCRGAVERYPQPPGHRARRTDLARLSEFAGRIEGC